MRKTFLILVALLNASTYSQAVYFDSVPFPDEQIKKTAKDLRWMETPEQHKVSFADFRGRAIDETENIDDQREKVRLGLSGGFKIIVSKVTPPTFFSWIFGEGAKEKHMTRVTKRQIQVYSGFRDHTVSRGGLAIFSDFSKRHAKDYVRRWLTQSNLINSRHFEFDNIVLTIADAIDAYKIIKAKEDPFGAYATTLYRLVFGGISVDMARADSVDLEDPTPFIGEDSE